MKKSYLVTGGCGFLGSALVRKLVRSGYRVRVLDDQSRGNRSRLRDVENDCEFVQGDIRNAEAVSGAVKGIESVCHLAFVNGTEFFYTKPDLVLDVGVRGMLNVMDACMAHGTEELVLASSSEVYHTAPVIPTDETAPLTIPDPLNPRYSYATAKLISEVLAFHYSREKIGRILVFRPHNVYGPEMGWEHVIPQFAIRMKALMDSGPGPHRFQIQGSGQETRSFIYVDDFTDGLVLMMESGLHKNIYHIGTTEEVTIERIAHMIAAHSGQAIEIVPSSLAAGGTLRRCPDIRKLAALGFAPKWSLEKGLAATADWYFANAGQAQKPKG